ncbi:spore coat protein YsxE [Desertibacillus haloalkaliphilus]|uniref:spore coat protein YsxE n=1 Tax=Desertibacillus haloalkaliphilus TaxID=1328930 RepID=UPI001C264675|nr:spore coat protein YsxE [Desertibacillus haloalkaliphilus]MBU8905062.1 spore coat protein YsxE [Desertibacillus haloalkaliphilus]
MTQAFAQILFYYDLYPEKIEHIGKVKKVTTSRGTFALKETEMANDVAEWFVHVMRRLDRLGYDQVIPLIPTKYGDYTISTGQRTYYLMPWMTPKADNPAIPKDIKIIEQMAKIHNLTEKTQVYSKDLIDQSYQTLLKRWGMRQAKMEQFAELAERKTYMSPFELTFLTHVQRMMHMAEEAKQHLKSWYEQCQENERFRSVLCHTRLSHQHVLFDDYGEPYLLNFEKAALDTPARDLALFYRRSFHHLWGAQAPEARPEGGGPLDPLYWFEVYEQIFLLKKEEKSLFASYLLFPEPIIHSIDTYRQNERYLSELQLVQRLERRLLNMRKVQRFTSQLFNDAREQKPLTD